MNPKLTYTKLSTNAEFKDGVDIHGASALMPLIIPKYFFSKYGLTIFDHNTAVDVKGASLNDRANCELFFQLLNVFSRTVKMITQMEKCKPVIMESEVACIKEYIPHELIDALNEQYGEDMEEEDGREENSNDEGDEIMRDLLHTHFSQSSEDGNDSPTEMVDDEEREEDSNAEATMVISEEGDDDLMRDLIQEEIELMDESERNQDQEESGGGDDDTGNHDDSGDNIGTNPTNNGEGGNEDEYYIDGAEGNNYIMEMYERVSSIDQRVTTNSPPPSETPTGGEFDNEEAEEGEEEEGEGEPGINLQQQQEGADAIQEPSEPKYLSPCSVIVVNHSKFVMFLCVCYGIDKKDIEEHMTELMKSAEKKRVERENREGRDGMSVSSNGRNTRGRGNNNKEEETESLLDQMEIARMANKYINYYAPAISEEKHQAFVTDIFNMKTMTLAFYSLFPVAVNPVTKAKEVNSDMLELLCTHGYLQKYSDDVISRKFGSNGVLCKVANIQDCATKSKDWFTPDNVNNDMFIAGGGLSKLAARVIGDVREDTENGDGDELDMEDTGTKIYHVPSWQFFLSNLETAILPWVPSCVHEFFLDRISSSKSMSGLSSEKAKYLNSHEYRKNIPNQINNKTPLRYLMEYEKDLKQSRKSKLRADSKERKRQVKESILRMLYVLNNSTVRSYLPLNVQNIMKFADENADPITGNININGEVLLDAKTGYGPYSQHLLQLKDYADIYLTIGNSLHEFFTLIMAIIPNQYNMRSSTHLNAIGQGEGEAGKSDLLANVEKLSIPKTICVMTGEDSRQANSSEDAEMALGVKAYDEMPIYMVTSEKNLKGPDRAKLNEMKAQTGLGVNVRRSLNWVEDQKTKRKTRQTYTYVTECSNLIIGMCNTLENKDEAFGTRFYIKTIAKNRGTGTSRRISQRAIMKGVSEEVSGYVDHIRSLQFTSFMIHMYLNVGIMDNFTNTMTYLVMYSVAKRLEQKGIISAGAVRSYCRIGDLCDELSIQRMVISSYFRKGGCFYGKSLDLMNDVFTLEKLLFHTVEDIIISWAFYREQYDSSLERRILQYWITESTNITDADISEWMGIYAKVKDTSEAEYYRNSRRAREIENGNKSSTRKLAVTEKKRKRSNQLEGEADAPRQKSRKLLPEQDAPSREREIDDGPATRSDEGAEGSGGKMEQKEHRKHGEKGEEKEKEKEEEEEEGEEEELDDFKKMLRNRGGTGEKSNQLTSILNMVEKNKQESKRAPAPPSSPSPQSMPPIEIPQSNPPAMTPKTRAQQKPAPQKSTARHKGMTPEQIYQQKVIITEFLMLDRVLGKMASELGTDSTKSPASRNKDQTKPSPNAPKQMTDVNYIGIGIGRQKVTKLIDEIKANMGGHKLPPCEIKSLISKMGNSEQMMKVWFKPVDTTIFRNSIMTMYSGEKSKEFQGPENRQKRLVVLRRHIKHETNVMRPRVIIETGDSYNDGRLRIAYQGLFSNDFTVITEIFKEVCTYKGLHARNILMPMMSPAKLDNDDDTKEVPFISIRISPNEDSPDVFTCENPAYTEKGKRENIEAATRSTDSRKKDRELLRKIQMEKIESGIMKKSEYVELTQLKIGSWQQKEMQRLKNMNSNGTLANGENGQEGDQVASCEEIWGKITEEEKKEIMEKKTFTIAEDLDEWSFNKRLRDIGYEPEAYSLYADKFPIKN